MNYAVIRSGGKQYKVSPGDVLELDKLAIGKDATITFEDVLLWVSDSSVGSGQVGREVKVGTPTVAGVKVKAKVLDQVKGKKIHIRKFKAKVRYRRHMGFRAQLTRVQIEKIESEKSQVAKASTVDEPKPAIKASKVSAKRGSPKQAS